MASPRKHLEHTFGFLPVHLLMNEEGEVTDITATFDLIDATRRSGFNQSANWRHTQ